MQAILRFKNRVSEKDEIIKMHQSVIIGRNENSTIQVADEKVSSAHCRITFKADYLEIIDLDSKNGTYLNGIRIEQSEVFMGDEVRIGDTVLTLNEERMHKVSTDHLTFPGPFKERLEFELRADFSGARIKSLAYMNANNGVPNSHYQSKELQLRKKAQSRIRLSKKEIKNKYKTLATLSQLIDLMFLLLIICIPFAFIESLEGSQTIKFAAWEFTHQDFSRNKITILFLEFALLGLYIVYNTKILKYTIGEKLSGIEEIHLKQD